MNLPIPDQAEHADCSRCGARVYRLYGLQLSQTPMFGMTERWGPDGQIVSYVGVPVYPAHACEAA